uniref:uncharacterized protein n=1 Tax=Myxine glutinosa TaxID=7769 RepID=UPI00358E08E7
MASTTNCGSARFPCDLPDVTLFVARSFSRTFSGCYDNVACDSKPHVTCDSKPHVACDSNPHVACDSNPHVACDSKPHVACDSKPHVACDSKPLRFPKSRQFYSPKPRKNQDQAPNSVQHVMSWTRPRLGPFEAIEDPEVCEKERSVLFKVLTLLPCFGKCEDEGDHESIIWLHPIVQPPSEDDDKEDELEDNSGAFHDYSNIGPNRWNLVPKKPPRLHPVRSIEKLYKT